MDKNNQIKLISNFHVFISTDGKVTVDAYSEDDSLWLTQKDMAILYGKNRNTIAQHLLYIFESEELNENTVCRVFQQSNQGGSVYETRFYNLLAIIAVGYRVNPKTAAEFRIWAVEILYKEINMDKKSDILGKKFTPKELMELAYQESLLSISEHKEKPDPMVGAIITTEDGKVLAIAHRGELRIGEHCEYTLIERKLKDKNLNNCILYVTLEPCIDEIRNPPKRGCATHIRKARIKKVYVGMRDPDIDIENQGVKKLLDAGIEVEDFPADLNQRIRLSLQEFIIFKETEKLVKQKERKEPQPYLQQIVKNTPISSFSDQAVNQFINNSGISFAYPSPEFNDWAISFDLASMKGSNIVPTTLGLLLFGASVEEIFPHSIFKVEIDYGDGKSEIQNITGPISLQLQKLIEYITQKALKLTIDRSTAKRTENMDFPIVILREVLANAIIHRDYTIEGASNYIYINQDKIIVKSPGLPILPFTIDDLRKMDLPSVSRNPKIMYVYNRMGMAESRGIGLRSLKSLPSKGFPLPLFNLIGNVLEITLVRNKSQIAEVKGLDNLSLSDEDREGLFYIQNNEPISSSDYASEFSLTKKTAQRRLSALVGKGIIYKEGEKRWMKYFIKK